MMKFKDRYQELIDRDNTVNRDTERRSMFYILSGYEDLFNKVDDIYNFEEHFIKPECLEDNSGEFSSTEIKLITLAFSHYNGYSADVREVLHSLDENTLELALNSMKLRYFR